MLDLYTALGWIGRRLHDVDGVRVGRVQDVFVDRGEPCWLVVDVGSIRRRETAVPVGDVFEDPDGALHVPYRRAELARMPLSNAEGLTRAGSLQVSGGGRDRP